MEENITKNFKLEEFLVSDSYPEVAKNMKLNENEKENLVNLTINILQPIRDFLDEPIKILSGFRSSKLNSMIGGSKTSDHMEGSAADITSNKIYINSKQVAYDIWNLNLPIRQLIYYPGRSFIHLSINTDSKPFKSELLVYKNKRYIKEK
jgi:uncharacterized protein YcbK (DUF882 family)